MTDERPNILLITTDQQRWDTIHAAGNKSIFTPHLNWLCDTGIRFDRAYSDCPVCMPARASIMTGLHAWRHGATGNVNAEPIRGRATLPGMLTEAGYQTRAQGKMHFHPMRANYGFEHMELSYDYYRYMRRTFPGQIGANHGMGQNEMEPVLGTAPEHATLTRWVVDRSVDFLETRDETRPFFLWSSISKPHPPFDPSPRFFELYRDMEPPAPVRGDWSETPEHVPPGFAGPTAHLSNVDRFSPEQLRQVRRAYYACITEIDAALGVLFARMREMDLMKNTWIIFTSDHGEMLGDHHIGGKQVMLEGSAHVPMIVRPAGEWDKNPLRGQTCDALVCLADLLPTCMQIADTRVPEELEIDGIDMLQSFNGSASRERIICQSLDQFGVVEKDLKYTFTSSGGDELLFNLKEDPMERRNLADELPEERYRLRHELTRTLESVHSPAVEDGHLRVEPARSKEDIRRWTGWPGFHSTYGDTDLLH